MNCQYYELLVFLLILAATLCFVTALWIINPAETNREDFQNLLLTFYYWPIYGSLTCIFTLLLGVWNNQSNINEDKRKQPELHEIIVIIFILVATAGSFLIADSIYFFLVDATMFDNGDILELVFSFMQNVMPPILYLVVVFLVSHYNNSKRSERKTTMWLILRVVIIMNIGMFLSFAGQKVHEILRLGQRDLLTKFAPALNAQKRLNSLDELLKQDLSRLRNTFQQIENLSPQNNSDEFIEVLGTDYINLVSKSLPIHRFNLCNFVGKTTNSTKEVDKITQDIKSFISIHAQGKVAFLKLSAAFGLVA